MSRTAVPGLAGEHEGRVVHPPAAPEDRVEVRHKLRMRQKIPERLRVRERPAEHAVELVDGVPLRVRGAEHAAVPVRVEGGVELVDLGFREEVLSSSAGSGRAP